MLHHETKYQPTQVVDKHSRLINTNEFAFYLTACGKAKKRYSQMFPDSHAQVRRFGQSHWTNMKSDFEVDIEQSCQDCLQEAFHVQMHSIKKDLMMGSDSCEHFFKQVEHLSD